MLEDSFKTRMKLSLVASYSVLCKMGHGVVSLL